VWSGPVIENAKLTRYAATTNTRREWIGKLTLLCRYCYMGPGQISKVKLLGGFRHNWYTSAHCRNSFYTLRSCPIRIYGMYFNKQININISVHQPVSDWDKVTRSFWWICHSLDKWRVRVRFQIEAEIFKLSKVSRPAVGTTHLYVQWILVAISMEL